MLTRTAKRFTFSDFFPCLQAAEYMWEKSKSIFSQQMRKFNFLRALLKQDPGAKGDKLFRLDNLTDRWPLWKLLRVKRSLFLKPDPPGTWWFFDLRIQPSTLFSNEEKAELKLSRFAVCWSCQCSSTSKSFSFSSSKWEMFFCSFYYLIYTEYLCAQWNVCHRNISAKNTSQWNPLIKK